MSIASLAIRMALTGELINRTLVGKSVFDSTIAPIDHFSEAGDKPFVSIAAEDHSATGFTVSDLTSGDRSFDLVIEIASGHRANVETSDGVVSVINLSESDAGKELTLDLIERQITHRIMTPDHAIWGDVLKSLIVKVNSVQTRRGIKAEAGARLAFRQMVISIDPLDDPAIGVAPAGIWADFLTACEADPETAALAPSIRSVIIGDEIPAHLFEWVSEGMKGDAASALRLLRADGSTEAAAPLSEVNRDEVYE